jgi:hypothetical protein
MHSSLNMSDHLSILNADDISTSDSTLNMSDHFKSSRSLCTISTLNSSYSQSSMSGSVRSLSLSVNTDVDINFSNINLDSPDSPLLTKAPSRKERKPIDISPNSYLPSIHFQKSVNSDNAKKILKER